MPSPAASPQQRTQRSAPAASPAAMHARSAAYTSRCALYSAQTKATTNERTCGRGKGSPGCSVPEEGDAPAVLAAAVGLTWSQSWLPPPPRPPAAAAAAAARPPPPPPPPPPAPHLLGRQPQVCVQDRTQDVGRPPGGDAGRHAAGQGGGGGGQRQRRRAGSVCHGRRRRLQPRRTFDIKGLGLHANRDGLRTARKQDNQMLRAWGVCSSAASAAGRWPPTGQTATAMKGSCRTCVQPVCRRVASAERVTGWRLGGRGRPTALWSAATLALGRASHPGASHSPRGPHAGVQLNRAANEGRLRRRHDQRGAAVHAVPVCGMLRSSCRLPISPF